MFFAIVHYPDIRHEGFHAFRNQYEPFAYLLPEHVKFVFPAPQKVGRKKLEDHIQEIPANWKPFRAHLYFGKPRDHWLFLGPGKDMTRLSNYMIRYFLTMVANKGLYHVDQQNQISRIMESKEYFGGFEYL